MSGFTKILVAVALLGAYSAALGQDGVIEKAPVPKWVQPSIPLEVPQDARGLVFVRYQDNQVHVDEKGQSSYTAYRLKLLHPNALNLGNISLSWNPAVGSPVVHKLLVHRDGVAIDVLETADFEILRREDQLEQAKLDGILTGSLRVPDLRVGDELEFASTTPSHDPTLGNTSFGLLFLASAPAPGRFRLGLSWDNGQKPNLQITDDFKQHSELGDRSIFVSLDNPAIQNPPKDAPPRYNWQRMLQYSDFARWEEISSRFHALFAKASTLRTDSPLKLEAARIAAAHGSESDRVAAALKLVQQQVRYIYVGLDGGNFTPATAEETWDRRYGDCKGKTALLLALLNELGINAEPVLVRNEGSTDGIEDQLPNPANFDHVLVRATVDGEVLWLDGTLPGVVRASIEPIQDYRWLLPLTQDGSGLEHRPWKAFDVPQEITLYEIDARDGFRQPAKITSTSIVRGLQGVFQEMQFSALTDTQLENAFKSQLAGTAQWDSVDHVSWRYDVDAAASILTISGTGPINWEDKRGGVQSLALPGGGFTPPSRRQRSADQDQSAPFYNEPEYSCYVTTVRFPDDTKAAEWTFNSMFDQRIFGRSYFRSFQIRDRSLSMVRGSRIEEIEIGVEDAARDNMRIDEFDNSKAVIEHDPYAGVETILIGSSVPTTFGYDWTDRDAPCLAGIQADVSE